MKRKICTGDTVFISSEPEYFDDCPICQAMKDIEAGKDLSGEDIKKAFEKSKDHGGIVGFSSDDNKRK